LASEWQQWYKHKIDAWQGSATIQTLTDAAYRAYHNLIMAQFQQEDGMLPNDDLRLAKMSRAGARWSEPRECLPTISEEVRASLTSAENGRLFSPTQHRIWCDARDKHLECVERMERLNRVKRGNPFQTANDPRSDARFDTRNEHRNDAESSGSTRGRGREEKKREKEEDSGAQASYVPPCKPVIFLPLVDGTEYPIEEAQLASWKQTFPAVDVMHHLNRMRAWLEANPRRKKTRAGIQQFAVAWLSKEQDKTRPVAGEMKKEGNRGQQRTDGNREAEKRAMEEIGSGNVGGIGGGPPGIG
jgi:hypothetical protein